MATIPPIIRHMVVCDDVQRAGGVRPRLNILGVVTTIRAGVGEGFPLRHTGLCVYLVLTGGIGTGRIQIRVTEADTEAQLFGSPVHQVTYPQNRHEVSGVIIRIEECVFPRPGLYWVEFHHDGSMLRREPVVVR